MASVEIVRDIPTGVVLRWDKPAADEPPFAVYDRDGRQIGRRWQTRQEGWQAFCRAMHRRRKQ